MTTARSPLRKLKAQADKIAAKLKAMERGEPSGAFDPANKVEAALTKEAIKFAVVMDDKILKIEMSWATIKAMSEAGISEYVLKYMREARDPVH